MGKKETKLAATEIVTTAAPSVPTAVPPQEPPADNDPILGPAHTAADFETCMDTKGMCVAPILSFDVLFNLVNDGNGTAASFRGIANGRAYFSEQKYATRLRHANEKATQAHVDGTTPAVAVARKSRYVDVTGQRLAEQIAEMLGRAENYAATMLRVPRAVADLLSGEGVDFIAWKSAYLARAVEDAQDALRTFARGVNRDAGERTTPTDDKVVGDLRGYLMDAHDICTADAAEVTVEDVTTARAGLADAWDTYKGTTTAKRSTLVDLSF